MALLHKKSKPQDEPHEIKGPQAGRLEEITPPFAFTSTLHTKYYYYPTILGPLGEDCASLTQDLFIGF